MSLARRNLAGSAQFAGFAPETGRPLFVPSGIRNFRTGPTNRAELASLLADASNADDPSEVSGVRVRSVPRPGVWLRLSSLFGVASRRAGEPVRLASLLNSRSTFSA
jgi:hypothetical protein